MHCEIQINIDMKRIIICLVAFATIACMSCKKEYTITVNSNNDAYGTVTGTGTYEKDATVTLSAIPKEGYEFESWQDGNTDNPRTITVSGDATYTATFVQKPSYADAFVGEYTVSSVATLYDIPILGTTTQELPDMDATIEKDGDNGEVILTMSGQTTTGYVNQAGLHVDPLIINQEISGYNVSITIAFPTISAPVNGVTSWEANISTSLAGIAVSGVAQMTATRK